MSYLITGKCSYRFGDQVPVGHAVNIGSFVDRPKMVLWYVSNCWGSAAYRLEYGKE